MALLGLTYYGVLLVMALLLSTAFYYFLLLSTTFYYFLLLSTAGGDGGE